MLAYLECGSTEMIFLIMSASTRALGEQVLCRVSKKTLGKDGVCRVSKEKHSAKIKFAECKKTLGKEIKYFSGKEGEEKKNFAECSDLEHSAKK